MTWHPEYGENVSVQGVDVHLPNYTLSRPKNLNKLSCLNHFSNLGPYLQAAMINRAQEGRVKRGLEKTTDWGALYSVLLTKYCSGEQIRKNEMGGECSTYGEE